MKTPIVTLVVGGMIVVFGTSGAAEDESRQMPGMTVDPCRDRSQQAIAVIDAASRRLEIARQSNSAAEMRVAVESLQAALVETKAKLTECVNAATPAASSQIPAGIGTAPQPAVAGAGPVTRPGSTTPAPGAPAAADRLQPTIPAASAPGASPNAATQSRTAPTSPAVTPERLDIIFKSVPSPPKVGENEFEVTVKRPDEKPFPDGDVSVLFVMPAMPQMKMPEVRNEVKLKSVGDGKYTGSGQVMMAGQWNVTVSVKQNGKEIAQKALTVAAK